MDREWPSWRLVLKAASAGALVASAITAALVLAEQKLRPPSGGPIDFSGPAFLLVVVLIALLTGILLSILCLGLTVWIFGARRLSGWHPFSATVMGAIAGAILGAMVIALLTSGPPEWQFGLLGSLYGGATAFFWSRLAR